MTRLFSCEIHCSRCLAANGGFTLIEVLVALAILGTSLFILLDTHFDALNLHDQTREAVEMDALMKQALGIAEVAVMNGTHEDGDDFGAAYPGYSYRFSAELIEEVEGVFLYDVMVTVSGPEEDKTLMMMLYDIGGSSTGT